MLALQGWPLWPSNYRVKWRKPGHSSLHAISWPGQHTTVLTAYAGGSVLHKARFGALQSEASVLYKTRLACMRPAWHTSAGKWLVGC